MTWAMRLAARPHLVPARDVSPPAQIGFVSRSSRRGVGDRLENGKHESWHFDPTTWEHERPRLDGDMAEVGIGAAFLFGIISFVSPCVLPLLPGYLSLMSGYSVGDLEAGTASTARMAKTTGLFVLGFTVVFVLLGAAATSLGQVVSRYQFTATRVAGWLVVAFGALIVVSAISNSPFLAGLMRERRMEVRPSRLGAWAPIVMGLAFGFAWTPCIGPVLAAILLTASVQETVGEGMVLLLSYALGLGVPFVLAGIGMTKMLGAVRFLRRYLRPINIASGLLLAAFGVLMITGNLARLSGWFQELFTTIGLDRLAEI
jgi:cytochrome c-type biogenesis protein